MAHSVRRREGHASGRHLATPERLGQRIKTARNSAGLTLSELAGRAGFSESTLSRIENGKTELGAHKLYHLADTLGIDVGSLFADEHSCMDDMLVSVSRKNKSPDFSTSRFHADILNSEISTKLMQPFVNTVTVSTLEAAGGCLAHAGEEFLLVLSGCINLHFEGRTPVALNEGDSIYFRGSLPHAYVNAAKSPSRILVVTSTGYAGSVKRTSTPQTQQPGVG